MQDVGDGIGLKQTEGAEIATTGMDFGSHRRNRSPYRARRSKIQCASRGDDDSYNAASTGDFVWEHEPVLSPREEMASLSFFIYCV